MHALKRLAKLKHIMDSRASWWRVTMPQPVFYRDTRFGMLHILLAMMIGGLSWRNQ